MGFSENLKAAMSARSCTVGALSAKLAERGVTVMPITIGHWLAGDLEPSMTETIETALALGVTVHYLLTGENPRGRRVSKTDDD